MSTPHLTGINKDNFEQWWWTEYRTYEKPPTRKSLKELIIEDEFYNKRSHQQSGVLLAYYDSLGIGIKYDPEDEKLYIVGVFIGVFETRDEAYLIGFERANSIVNKR